MPTTLFGEHLKREREMRGVSLEEVAAATRIAPRFLEAIENEHWEQLPGGAFNRGFIRSVARFLGLDEDDLVAEYALATKDRVEPGVFRPPPLERSRKWIALAVAILLIVFLLAGGWFLITRFGPGIFARMHKSRAAAASSAPSAPAIQRTNHPSPARAAPPPRSAVIQQADHRPAPPTTAPPSMAVASPRRPGVASPPAAAIPTVNVATGPLELKLQVTKLAKVRVVADGRILLDRHLKPGQTKRFHARDIFLVASTDAGGLQLQLNGQTIPAPGAPGQQGGITLTHKDLKTASGVRH